MSIRIQTFLLFVLVAALLYFSVLASLAQAEDPGRYFIKSDSGIVKALAGVHRNFDGGFTSNLTDGQLRAIERLTGRLGIVIETVPKWHISAPPGACSPWPECKNSEARFVPVELDVTNEDSIENCLDQIIKKNKIIETFEFFPEEGKYHIDGHRNCNFSCEPKETKRLKNKCPKCGRELVVGVLSRVEDLADRKIEKEMLKRKPYRSIIPLPEVLSEVLEVGPQSKTVMTEYERLILEFKNEFNILLEVPIKEFEPRLGEAIKRMREGKVNIAPGFDGEFGKVQIFRNQERLKKSRQKKLF